MQRSITALFLVLVATVAAMGVAMAEAPFGDKVSAAFMNYNRAAPMIGSAGKLGPGGVAEAKALGFVTVIDLRGPTEGVEAEQADAGKVGIAYVNVPVTDKAPRPEQVEQISAILSDPTRLPVLIHCQSGNRVGAFWALYRAAKGVPAAVAVEEGQTLGLSGSREQAVRAKLGLPVQAK